MKESTEINKPATPSHTKVESLHQKLESYRKFVMSVASAGNKTKYEQLQQGCIGIATEAGELLDNMKKSMFQERNFDRVNALEECGDILFYMTELLEALDSDIFECMKINTYKLESRYGGKRFDKDKSLNRDTDAERVVLEDLTDSICGTCIDRDNCDKTKRDNPRNCADYTYEGQ